MGSFNIHQCGMLIRIITEHTELYQYLFNKKIKGPIKNEYVSSPLCTNCNNKVAATVVQYIGECAKYKLQRKILMLKLSGISHIYQFPKYRFPKYILFLFIKKQINLTQQISIWTEILSYIKSSNRSQNTFKINLKLL